MKKMLAILLVLVIAFASVNAYAGDHPKGSKGPSAMAMEKASDESAVDKIGDWLATRGKSKEERVAIKAERKAKRAAKRAGKKARKKSKQLKKQTKKSQKDMKKKMGKKGS